MRRALIIGPVFVVLLLVLGSYAGWRLFGFVQTRAYESYAAAAADDVFAGGLLPAFVPGSATGLSMTVDYDVRIGHGEFRYDPADTAAFLARLSPWRGGDAPFNDYAARVAERQSDGYRAYEYADARSVWVFFVDGEAGHVLYDMWHDGGRRPSQSVAPPAHG